MLNDGTVSHQPDLVVERMLRAAHRFRDRAERPNREDAAHRDELLAMAFEAERYAREVAGEYGVCIVEVA